MIDVARQSPRPAPASRLEIEWGARHRARRSPSRPVCAEPILNGAISGLEEVGGDRTR